MHKLFSKYFRTSGSLKHLYRKTTPCRCLSINETATALRPFYFVVHPDLFGQYPKERVVNEESLKRLHEYLTSLQKTGKATPTELKFFVRPKDKQDLNSVTVNLDSENLRSTVTTVLRSVHLPLDYVKNLPQKRYIPVEIRWDPTYYHVMGMKNPYKEYYQKRKDWTLLGWLSKNAKKALSNRLSSLRIQEEVAMLEREITCNIGLNQLVWNNDWGIMHCLACLRSFHRLYLEHPSTTRHALKDRNLVFSKKTGVNQHGEIILSMEEVPTDWLKLLKIVDAYKGMVDRLPYLENKLSELLANISVVRQHRQHNLLAEEYELLLNQILNTLSRNQEEVDHYLGREDLSHLQLIVERSSAPLTLSSSGHFVVPATVPGPIIVKFLSENKEMSFTILKDMELLTRMGNVVKEQCKDRLSLTSLERGENVTPTQMSVCCERLIDDAVYLESYLSGSHVFVSHYYAVTKDGGIHIPWNWKSDIS